MDTLLKKPEIKRDEFGRFEQNGTGLRKRGQAINKQPNNEAIAERVTLAVGAGKPGPGRPKGSKNKTSAALREQILASLDRVGGIEYLARLAIENSSAYASLLGKVLPSTLDVSDSGGGAVKVTFERVIVRPDGHREVVGVTPKQLPAPSQDLPKSSIPRLPAVGEIVDIEHDTRISD